MTSNQGKKPNRYFRTDRFLETLRELGSGIVDSAVHDMGGGLAKEAFDQVTGKKSGELKPNQSLDFDKLDYESERKEKPARQFQQEFLNIRYQERMLWKRAEQETKLQIEAILQELKQIVSSTEKLTKEVSIAAQQMPVDPGAYHISFFEKLHHRLILFRKSVEQSATWLSAFNQKAKKRNYYWAQVKKSGTKFMLSQERYMATQAG